MHFILLHVSSFVYFVKNKLSFEFISQVSIFYKNRPKVYHSTVFAN